MKLVTIQVPDWFVLHLYDLLIEADIEDRQESLGFHGEEEDAFQQERIKDLEWLEKSLKGTVDRIMAGEVKEVEVRNTKIEYLYRDASNYKARTTVVWRGEITDDERLMIHNGLKDAKYFIPHQVNMEDLQWTLGPENEDDHPWHELVDITLTDELTLVYGDIHMFAAQFRNIKWEAQ